jgi:hypothetical protein
MVAKNDGHPAKTGECQNGTSPMFNQLAEWVSGRIAQQHDNYIQNFAGAFGDRNRRGKHH